VGSFCNHWKKENTEVSFNSRKRIANYIAKRNIRKGEEITINYGNNDKSFDKIKPLMLDI